MSQKSTSLSGVVVDPMPIPPQASQIYYGCRGFYRARAANGNSDDSGTSRAARLADYAPDAVDYPISAQLYGRRSAINGSWVDTTRAHARRPFSHGHSAAIIASCYFTGTASQSSGGESSDHWMVVSEPLEARRHCYRTRCAHGRERRSIVHISFTPDFLSPRQLILPFMRLAGGDLVTSLQTSPHTHDGGASSR